MDEQKSITSLNLTPEQLIKMFTDQWDLLAPTAYGNFVKDGRGAFLVDFAKPLLAENGMMSPEMHYVPANNLDFLEDLLSNKTKDLMKTYDAEKMVLLLVHFRNNDIKTIFIGTGGGLKSPKELYEDREKRVVN